MYKQKISKSKEQKLLNDFKLDSENFEVVAYKERVYGSANADNGDEKILLTSKKISIRTN